MDKLCLHVAKDYPGDVGCFCVYFLNYVQLKPGESMFMAANEPHAYLSGGACTVCVACRERGLGYFEYALAIWPQVAQSGCVC